MSGILLYQALPVAYFPDRFAAQYNLYCGFVKQLPICKGQAIALLRTLETYIAQHQIYCASVEQLSFCRVRLTWLYSLEKSLQHLAKGDTVVADLLYTHCARSKRMSTCEGQAY